jgi:uncharacterized protein (TIGR02145 family)
MRDYEDHSWAPWRGRYRIYFGKLPFLFDSSALSITDVVIEKGVTHIGDLAFAYLPELRSFTIPVSVSSIGNKAFFVCDNLKSAVIPGNIKTIGDDAFFGKSLRSVVIENGVTVIGKKAFFFCEGLTSVTIPGSVTSTGYSMFGSCINLTSVTIEEGVATIGERTFYDCANLMSVTIPSSVTSIGDKAFFECANLTYITCLNPAPPAVSGKAFDRLPSDVCLYVQNNSIDSYRNADLWKGFECVKPIGEATEAASLPLPTPVQAVGGSNSSFTDFQNDKNYRTIKIGTQTWMAENLSDGYYCYDGDESNCETYGSLYTWDVAIYACPNGWHLPSHAEWMELTYATKDRMAAGKKLKSKAGWNDDDGKSGNGTDAFGFSALPGGRHSKYAVAIGTNTGAGVASYTRDTSYDVGFAGYWWSATEHSGHKSNSMYAYGRYMNNYIDGIHENIYDKNDGLSVRCVKDGGEKSITFWPEKDADADNN